jgi:hypothetical protein
MNEDNPYLGSKNREQVCGMMQRRHQAGHEVAYVLLSRLPSHGSSKVLYLRYEATKIAILPSIINGKKVCLRRACVVVAIDDSK